MARAAQDALGVLRGLQIVAEAVCREQRTHTKHIWSNSSIRELLEQQLKQSVDKLRAAGEQPSKELKQLQNYLQETGERAFVVTQGIQQLAKTRAPTLDFNAMSQTLSDLGRRSAAAAATSTDNDTKMQRNVDVQRRGSATKLDAITAAKLRSTTAAGSGATHLHTSDIDAANLDISSITLKELEEILSKRGQNRNVSLRTSHTKSKQVAATATEVQENVTEATPTPTATSSSSPSSSSSSTTATSKIKFGSSQQPPNAGVFEAETHYVENLLKFVAGTTTSTTNQQTAPAQTVSSPKPKTQNVNNTTTTTAAADIAAAATATKDLPELSKVAKQRRVPSSRIGRMASFGGLFAGLGIGTINELTKGALGLGGSTNMREALLSPANAERIVDTLCKVRGAALKIGQILSIQDSNVVSPQLAKAFERVRQAADYMPDWQVERVMNTQLGPQWRAQLTTFDDKPFAAASIGQVHRATLKNGMQVAIKIQYPGVAQSIESDIDNLVGMLKVWDVFPQGFFIDNVVRVAKRELNWEVDYTREAEYTEKFKEMIAAYPEYYVPTVIRELTTSSVLTTELVPGVPLDKCFDLSYEHRKHIAASILKLCLRELFEIQCMQTDPNWSNFLYDAASKRLMLIDFGSTRFYQYQFIKNYRHVIICAANDDRQGVLEMSREMGFLTGYETKQMEKAHVEAVMILGEIFRYDGDFDFGKQNTTERIAQLVPTMVAHRLCPPPEEIYSIHRKLSGIFLLCARLNVTMNCRPFYEEIVLNKFKEQ